MIFDISDSTFKNILNDEALYLPIRWDGSDFSATLKELLDHYVFRLNHCVFRQLGILPHEPPNDYNCIKINLKNIEQVCDLLLMAVRHYLNGFPAKAYHVFKQAMDLLMKNPLEIYQKSVMDQFEVPGNHYRNNDELNLFRVVLVQDNKPYTRTRVFHTPYTMRSKVSTSRYSIAGYPSLYLGTTLSLCCEEIHMNPHQDFALASKYKLERSFEYTNINIRVIELGAKPQDFLEFEYNTEHHNRRISTDLLDDNIIKSSYLLWYPLIASCSYIRTDKKDPFAAEYIIPQLLMQWVRNEIGTNNELVGIRYFSCASMKASNMGFNYVFPTSGNLISENLPYCSVLAKAFRLTSPVYIHEYDSPYACESQLIRSNDLDFINNG